MRVAIVGYNTEGKSSYEYFAAQGHAVTICDQNMDLEIPLGANTAQGDTYLQNLDRFDIVVRTAGIHPDSILLENPGLEAKITTQINEFLRVCPTHNVIGVTGTKGKGTTSTLIAKMLEAVGKQVFLGGNIGVAPMTFLPQITEDSWVVLELSSFQLIDLAHSPHIGVCLMVVPEHLNWHADMNEYIVAKSRLFEHQTNQDIAMYMYGNENSSLVAGAGEGQKIAYYHTPGAWIDDNMIVMDGQTICATKDIRLLGEHNLQNICAAITATWVVHQDVDAMRGILTSFTGLEHRLEFVQELDGVRYYDDSFGTTPETAIVAIKAFEEPKVVILGGSDKGVPFDKLARAVADNNVRTAVVIGDTGPAIAKALDTVGYTNYVNGGDSMAGIVAKCRKHAETGDVVLLSTGCASFGLFQNYKDRAAQFVAAVRNLA